ncbi:MAG: UbiA family prenyltransferase [Chitinispirillaceae bacterium]|nr:UbiA family prenyltransferase [Chitinispirillaceae bacterium]
MNSIAVNIRRKSGTLKTTFKMLSPIALVAIAAGLQMAGALLFFKTAPDPFLIAGYVFITFGVYLFNRFTDCEDGFNCPEQRHFFQEQSRLILIPILVLSISILVLSATGRLSFWHIVLIVAGMFYSLRLIPHWRLGSIHFIRMKDIFFVKNLSVSILWSITPFAIAASQPASVIPVNADLIVIVLAFSITTLINTTTCDVRDIAGDRHVGVTTVATKLGKKRTGQYLFGLGLFVSIAVGTAFTARIISRPASILFVVTMTWTAFVSLPIYIKELRIPRNLAELLIDTQAIVCGVGLITLTLV